jgi:AcrR family transcriptional regulator
VAAGRTRAQRLSAPERRESLLDIALAVFAQRGYHATFIEAIAAAAGVSKPVVYDHFASKVELYRALLEREAERLVEALAAEDPDTAPVDERLERTARRLVEFAREHRESWRVLFVERVSDEGIASTYRELRRSSVRLIAQITESDPRFDPPPGTDRSVAAEMLAELQFVSYVAAATWAHEHEEVAIDHVLALFMDFVWIGIERTQAGEHWHGR